MSQNTFETKGGQTYETPVIEVMDVVSEGVFCSSTTKANPINPWERNPGSLDF